MTRVIIIILIIKLKLLELFSSSANKQQQLDTSAGSVGEKPRREDKFSTCLKLEAQDFPRSKFCY